MILFLLNRKKIYSHTEIVMWDLWVFFPYFLFHIWVLCLRRTRTLVWFFVYFSPLPPGALTFLLLLPSCRRLSKTHICRMLTRSTPCPDGRKPSQDPSFPQPSIASSLSALIGKQMRAATLLMSGHTPGPPWAGGCWEVSWLPHFGWKCTFYGLNAIVLGFHTQLAEAEAEAC